MRNIAVIGAGMAGCTLARRLVDGGLDVHVFDKGRAAGGRMATRRGEGMQFDHGAQFVTARGAALMAQLEDLQRAGVVAPWVQAFPGHGGTSRWVGVPGMNALAPRLLWGAEVHLQTAVTGIGRDRFGWWLATEAGRRPECFDAVLLTVPAPQALSLLERVADVDTQPLTGPIREIRYAPCWALMLSFAERVDAPDTLRFDDGGMLAWAARDSSKPQRDAAGECWIVHADPGWSQENVELSAEQAEALMIDAFAAAVGTLPAPAFRRAHRWRYARVLQPIGVDCLWDPLNGLGYASDGCLGERIEDAFESASALAGRVLAVGVRGTAPP